MGKMMLNLSSRIDIFDIVNHSAAKGKNMSADTRVPYSAPLVAV